MSQNSRKRFSGVIVALLVALTVPLAPLFPQRSEAVGSDPLTLEFVTSASNGKLSIGIGGVLTGVVINWGDLDNDSSTADVVTNVPDQIMGDIFVTQNASAAGTYAVTITGTTLEHFGKCESPGFAGNANENLKRVTSWGNVGLISLECAFAFRHRLLSVPTNIPSSVTNLNQAFSGAYYFDQDLSSWDTSNVTTMRGTFFNAAEFTNLGNPLSWETQNVTDMSDMFAVGTFNSDISMWNTSQVRTMSGMFRQAARFNAAIGGWNTANVADMSGMFDSATAFNQSLDNWNVRNVEDMSRIFSPVVNMAPPPMFDPSLPMTPIITYTYSLTDENYSRTLIGWASQTVKPNLTLSAQANKAVGCEAVAARAALNAAPNSWTFNDIAPTDVVPADGCQQSNPSDPSESSNSSDPSNSTQLASTGSNIMGILIIALGVIGFGVVVLLVIFIARRRKL